MGTGYFFSGGRGGGRRGVKRLGRDVDHSPPFSAKVKNQRSCTSAPPLCLHGVVKENVTLLYHLPSDHLGHAVT